MHRALKIQYGSGHRLFSVHIIAYLALGLYVLANAYRQASGIQKPRLRLLIIGLSLPITGLVSTNVVIPVLFKNSQTGFYGPVFAVIFFLFTAHAFIRYRLLDVTLVIKKSVTWTLALFASLAPLLFALTLFWPFFSARFHPSELAFLLVGSTVIGLLTPLMRDVAGRALDKYVYRRRTNYQLILKDASRLLTRVLNVDVLMLLIAEAITNSIGTAFVMIFLRGQDDVFRCVSHHSAMSSTELPAPPMLPARVVQNLSVTKEPLTIEEHSRHYDVDFSPRETGEAECHCSLFLPIVSDDNLIGVIGLGSKRSGDAYFTQDIDLLSTLANQAGVAIKNAQLYEQVVLINEYLQNILATIESGVVAVNQLGHVTIFNRAAEGLTGLVADAVRGRSIGDLPGVLGDPLRATATDGQQRVLAEVELLRPDGSTLPIICLTSALREPAGTLLGAVTVFSDLTPLKQLETERRRAERLAYFESLAAGIAHEIKNPLVAIKTFTQLLPRKFQDDQFRERFGRVANREIGRMEHLVDRLRALAKPSGRPHRQLEICEPISDALELLQPRLEERGIATLWASDPEPHPILGDHEALEQLFLNLFLNALEAMEPGGTLSVRVDGADGSTIVRVEDTGPGIPEALQARMFDPFVTTKLHGSGLGLAICASIANAHGARIHAGNKSGRPGAVFTIEFPAGAMAPAPMKA